jgi:hypothetical protein
MRQNLMDGLWNRNRVNGTDKRRGKGYMSIRDKGRNRISTLTFTFSKGHEKLKGRI